MKGDDIADRLLALAVEALRAVETFPKGPVGKHIGTQLAKSATGGGSNYEEARAAESRADFVHKLSVATKEVRETVYWLRVAERAQLGRYAKLAQLTKEAHELVAILMASIRTAKGKQPGRREELQVVRSADRAR
jgi:four helix bundle protein